MSALLQPQFAQVSAHGELVVLRIGDFSKAMQYPLALQISAAMLVEARYARAEAKVCRRWHAAGVMHDADAPKTRWSRFRAKLPEMLRAKGVSVGRTGQIVQLTIDRTTADMPFDVAVKLSQWLRIQGKQARNSAGDNRHWTLIGNLAAAEAGERPW